MRLFAIGYPLKISVFVTAVFLFLLLAGCGQKGDLYQPETSMVGGDVFTPI